MKGHQKALRICASNTARAQANRVACHAMKAKIARPIRKSNAEATPQARLVGTWAASPSLGVGKDPGVFEPV